MHEYQHRNYAKHIKIGYCKRTSAITEGPYNGLYAEFLSTAAHLCGKTHLKTPAIGE